MLEISLKYETQIKSKDFEDSCFVVLKIRSGENTYYIWTNDEDWTNRDDIEAYDCRVLNFSAFFDSGSLDADEVEFMEVESHAENITFDSAFTLLINALYRKSIVVSADERLTFRITNDNAFNARKA